MSSPRTNAGAWACVVTLAQSAEPLKAPRMCRHVLPPRWVSGEGVCGSARAARVPHLAQLRIECDRRCLCGRSVWRAGFGEACPSAAFKSAHYAQRWVREAGGCPVPMHESIRRMRCMT